MTCSTLGARNRALLLESHLESQGRQMVLTALSPRLLGEAPLICAFTLSLMRRKVAGIKIGSGPTWTTVSTPLASAN